MKKITPGPSELLSIVFCLVVVQGQVLWAQNKTISMDARGKTLKEVLQQIQVRSGLYHHL